MDKELFLLNDAERSSRWPLEELKNSNLLSNPSVMHPTRWFQSLSDVTNNMHIYSCSIFASYTSCLACYGRVFYKTVQKQFMHAAIRGIVYCVYNNHAKMQFICISTSRIKWFLGKPWGYGLYAIWLYFKWYIFTGVKCKPVSFKESAK